MSSEATPVVVFDANYLALTAIITVGFQFVFFLITAIAKFDKVTDFAGGSNFLILALVTFLLHRSYTARQIVLTMLVVAWALRLALFLLVRILLWGKDARFDDKRNSVAKLAVFWSLQAVWVYCVSLSVIFVNTSTVDAPIGALDGIGWAIFALALIVETTADFQKLFYKRRPESKGHWCDVGLWKWSRHPNYAGEISVWLGAFIAATPVLRGGAWAAVISPIFITLLLLFLSGMPLLERQADERYLGPKSKMQEEYAEYKHRTSPLVLLPPALYKRLPKVVKAIFFFEWPLYNPGASKVAPAAAEADSAATDRPQAPAAQPTETSPMVERRP